MEIRTHSMLAPHLNAQDPLVNIMNSAANFANSEPYEGNGIFWPASHYRLHQTSVFNRLGEEQQNAILRQLSHWSLSLSYYIEKFGLNYGAFMINQAQSTEEKSLYGLFTSEEVQHRLWLEQFLLRPVQDGLDFHPLLPALALALRDGSRETLVFTIQVVLEGFGIHHYANLRETCLSPQLAQVFTNILKDEFHHHGMGVVLTQKMQLSPQTQNQIEELTVLFVRALIEAEWVVKAVEQNTGGMTNAQKSLFLQEVHWEQQIKTRIERLQSLMRKVGYQGMVERLETKGAFKGI